MGHNSLTPGLVDSKSGSVPKRNPLVMALMLLVSFWALL